MPEVEAVSGMLEGFVDTEGVPFFFVFGYPEDSFILGRFQITDGFSIFRRKGSERTGNISCWERLLPISWINLSAIVSGWVQVFIKSSDCTNRGMLLKIWAILELGEAQTLLGKPRQVSIFYIQLEDLP
jgi:hypothetical protein